MKSLKKNINQALEIPAKIINQALVLPADVSLEFPKTCQRGEQLDCRLTIKSHESAISIEKIIISLVAEEKVEIDAGYQSGYGTVEKDSIALMTDENMEIDTDYLHGYDSESNDVMVTIYVGTVTSESITVNKAITLSNATNLDPNKEYSWMANFTVPINCNATYLGVHANHIWHLTATIALANRKLLSKKNFSYKWDGLVIS